MQAFAFVNIVFQTFAFILLQHVILSIMKEGDNLSTGEKIKQARKEAGLTQKELGDKLGITYQQIGQYENGKRKPKLETLQRIADALEIEMLSLLTKEYITQTDITQKDFHDWIDTLGETKSDRINELFDNLNEEGQDKAIDLVELLTKIPEYRKDE